MIPSALKKGDTVAVVSLSRGILGEDSCAHYLKIGQQRLTEMGLNILFMPNALKGIDYLAAHPKARADDLKAAFYDDNIKGIICAIGGDDTFKLAPYLLDDPKFCKAVLAKPKLFTGFSDTTVDHLMFYQLGIRTFYGPNFINDLSEMDIEMLSYTKDAFLNYYMACDNAPIVSSPIWFEERTDFSASQIGTPRIKHLEQHGYQLLQGNAQFSGQLLGGCLESLYDLVVGERYPEEAEINKQYQLFPSRAQWRDAILFFETSEKRSSPDKLRKMLAVFKSMGVFDVIAGMIIGKPQNEYYYEAYKQVIMESVDRPDLPILYNVNFGHAYPRTVLAYGATAHVDADAGSIRYLQPVLND